MSGPRVRVELRMRGRLTPRLASAFTGMRVSETAETTLVTRAAGHGDAERMLSAVGALRRDVLAIRAIDDGEPR